MSATGGGEEPEEEEEEEVVSVAPSKPPLQKPRRWIEDRCDGNERVMNPDSRPCCFIFYTPLLIKCFPDILETNGVMRSLGRIGLVSPTNHRARKWIMILATLSTIVGWAFLIFSDFAISTNYSLIDAAAFNIGSASIQSCRPGDDEECDGGALLATTEATRYALGLKAIAYTRYKFDQQDLTNPDSIARLETETVVTTFDDFCDGDQGFRFVDDENCQKCEDASRAMVASILMSTVTYFFTLTTDVLRIWPNCKLLMNRSPHTRARFSCCCCLPVRVVLTPRICWSRPFCR